jgi:hypothetical protein
MMNGNRRYERTSFKYPSQKKQVAHFVAAEAAEFISHFAFIIRRWLPALSLQAVRPKP